MQKLANISNFEKIQANANKSMGMVSDLSVFNSYESCKAYYQNFRGKFETALHSFCDEAAIEAQEHGCDITSEQLVRIFENTLITYDESYEPPIGSWDGSRFAAFMNRHTFSGISNRQKTFAAHYGSIFFDYAKSAGLLPTEASLEPFYNEIEAGSSFYLYENMRKYLRGAGWSFGVDLSECIGFAVDPNHRMVAATTPRLREAIRKRKENQANEIKQEKQQAISDLSKIKGDILSRWQQKQTVTDDKHYGVNKGDFDTAISSTADNGEFSNLTIASSPIDSGNNFSTSASKRRGRPKKSNAFTLTPDINSGDVID